ncbi:MAG: gliding motility lipoprotein GldH [Marinilabiliales bacterium]|nr:gliding motility lipoprotein GldH [Marinilabiliales bacterium]
MATRTQRTFSNTFLLLFFCLTVASCGGKLVFSEYKTLQGARWHQDSILRFDLTIPDSSKLYNLFLNVRNEGRYPYSNLWLFVNITPPKGQVIHDTIELSLATPEGKWLGYGLGDLYDMKYPYKQTTFFPTAGYYRLEIRQGMRTEDGFLKGIHDFGVTLDHSN